MNSFQQKFRKYINDNRLFEPTDRILLAVSGGMDSVVLAHLFAQEHTYWAIAHANFQLRAKESDEDAAFVRELAARYRVRYHTRSFETGTYAQQQQVSTQMAARELRRAWFLELLAREKYDYIALAHHHNDQLETLLLNLIKGSGISGLRAMLPKKEVWIRPLLFALKEEVAAYLREHRLPWREDRTNAEDKYQRNWVRHRVIPAMQEINPSLLSTSQHTVERLREVEAVFRTEVDRMRKKAVSEAGGEVSIRKKLLLEHPQGSSLLAEWLSPYGFSWAEVQQIMAALGRGAQPGLQFRAAGHQLWIEREALVLLPEEAKAVELSLFHEEGQTTRTALGDLVAKVWERNAYRIRAEPSVAALDYQQLRFPLELRTWQPGDAFVPLGMTHRKKISDFLVDAKVPRYQKQRVLVLLSDAQVVWVVGYRMDHRFRVTDDTKLVYEIVWHPANV